MEPALFKIICYEKAVAILLTVTSLFNVRKGIPNHSFVDVVFRYNGSIKSTEL